MAPKTNRTAAYCSHILEHLSLDDLFLESFLPFKNTPHGLPLVNCRCPRRGTFRHRTFFAGRCELLLPGSPLQCPHEKKVHFASPAVGGTRHHLLHCHATLCGYHAVGQKRLCARTARQARFGRFTMPVSDGFTLRETGWGRRRSYRLCRGATAAEFAGQPVPTLFPSDLCFLVQNRACNALRPGDCG